MTIDFPASVTRSTGPGGLACFDIATPSCAGRVFALGATVTSYRPQGADEVLWVSSKSDYRVGCSISGGIPICAPWFGKGRGFEQVPQVHGFVRDVEWHLAAAREAAGVVELVFELGPEDVVGQPGADRYPADLRYRYVVRFGHELNVELSVTSPTTSFILDEALHTYLAVSDIHTARISGLEGAFYVDAVPGGTDQVQHGDITFVAETDRVFSSEATCVLIDGKRRVRIDKAGSATTVVWNPWVAKAAAMNDFGDDEWREMVCIETANALGEAVEVAAGTTCTMSATLCAG